MGLEEADGAASPTKKAKHGRVAHTIDDWKKKCRQLESKLLRLQHKVSGESPVKGQRGRPKGRGKQVYEVEGKQLHWNLKRHVQGLLAERTTNGAEAWSQLVVAVLRVVGASVVGTAAVA